MKRAIKNVDMEQIQRILENRKAPVDRINQEIEKQRTSAKELSEITSIDLDRIKPFLQGQRAHPDVYYVAAVCKCLGLSLDELFLGACNDDETENEQVKQLRQDLLAEKDKWIEKYKEDLTEAKAEIKALKKEKRRANRFAGGFGVTAVILAAVVLKYVKIDTSHLNIGFVRDPLMVPLAITVSAIILAASVLAIVMFVLMLRNEKNRCD